MARAPQKDHPPGSGDQEQPSEDQRAPEAPDSKPNDSLLAAMEAQGVTVLARSEGKYHARPAGIGDVLSARETDAGWSVVLTDGRKLQVLHAD